MKTRSGTVVALLLVAASLSVLAVLVSVRQGAGDGTSEPGALMEAVDFAPRTYSSTVRSDPPTGVPKYRQGRKDGNGGGTRILGFADSGYKEHAVRWYRRLERLGYDGHVVVATDNRTVSYLQQMQIPRFERMPYDTCLEPTQDKRGYRRQLFGRRWKHIVDTLRAGSHVLLTDVDNVFARYVPMSEFEDSAYDVIHAYSTSYPEDAFYGMGFTVCGGMGWYRSSAKVWQFAGTLLNTCNCLKSVDCKCYCDDQVVLNHLLWKGKHTVAWDQPVNATPKDLADWQWDSRSGTSSKTGHRVHVWNRTFAYRGPMPDRCCNDTWVAMPLYVEKENVNQAWDELCGVNVG